jgi:oligosaccharide repeat unit polymerase
MTWVAAFAVPFAVVGLNRLIHGWRIGFNPWIAMVGAWGVVIALFLVNPLHLNHLHARTWWLIAAALSAYTAGYGVVLLARRTAASDANFMPLPRPRAIPSLVRGDRRERHVRWLWRGTLLWFSTFLLLFLRYVVAHYGPNLIHDLGPLRVDLGAATGVPIGFYFFYAATLMVPLGVVLYRTTGHRRFLVLAGIGLLSLPLTSGRTNAILALLWTVAILAYQRGDRRFGAVVLTRIAMAAVAVLVFFVFTGNVIGKTYGNSALSRQLPTSGFVPTSLRLPYIYGVGQLPALDQVTAGQQPLVPTADSTHMSSLRPFFQLANLADRHIQVPGAIEPYWSTPYAFNNSSYIGPLYQDFGTTGVLVFSLLFGAFAAWAYLQWLKRPDVGTGLLVALCTVVAVTSTINLKLGDLSTCAQAAALIVLVRAERPAARDRVISPRGSKRKVLT